MRCRPREKIRLQPQWSAPNVILTREVYPCRRKEVNMATEPVASANDFGLNSWSTIPACPLWGLFGGWSKANSILSLPSLVLNPLNWYETSLPCGFKQAQSRRTLVSFIARYPLSKWNSLLLKSMPAAWIWKRLSVSRLSWGTHDLCCCRWKPLTWLCEVISLVSET